MIINESRITITCTIEWWWYNKINLQNQNQKLSSMEIFILRKLFFTSTNSITVSYNESAIIRIFTFRSSLLLRNDLRYPASIYGFGSESICQVFLISYIYIFIFFWLYYLNFFSNSFFFFLPLTFCLQCINRSDLLGN